MADSNYFCRVILSGGQTGVDRAALDFAIACGYGHGGFCPAGRRAEDGRIPDHYDLIELGSAGYRQRTRRNVEESDGTLVLVMSECTGGSRATVRFAEMLSKPRLVVDLAADDALEQSVLDWMAKHDIQRLNVAGPRESKNPGVYCAALRFLELMHATDDLRASSR
jgi:hypothetical protein